MDAITDIASYAPQLRVSPDWSRVFADQLFGFALAVFSVGALLYALWAWSKSSALGKEVWKKRGLRAGPILLPGIAHPTKQEPKQEAKGAQPLVELTIRQAGTSRRGKRKSYVEWRETSRQLDDRPFLLRTDGGDEVLVESQGRIELVDRLEPPIRTGLKERLRVARIIPGERVWIRGVLSLPSEGGQGPYRGGSASVPTLRPAPRGSLFISSEPVGNEHGAMARFHLVFAWLFIAALGWFQGATFRPYHLLRAHGEVTDAVVLEHRQWTTRNKNATTHHYSLRLEFDCPTGRAVVDEETNYYAYTQLGDGAVAPITFLRDDPTVSQIGRVPEMGTTIARVGLAAVVTGALLFAYVLGAVMRRPWWKRKHLVEYEQDTMV